MGKVTSTRIILDLLCLTKIYAAMLRLDLSVSCCHKIKTDLKIIIRYDSFVEQKWRDFMTTLGFKINLSQKTVMLNGPLLSKYAKLVPLCLHIQYGENNSLH